MSDPVNSPSHYTFGRFEVIDVLEDWFPDDPLLWQVGKYIARAWRKDNALEDLKKARWYLDRRIARLESEGSSK
jgi:chaperonin cofactor prefoldin